MPPLPRRGFLGRLLGLLGIAPAATALGSPSPDGPGLAPRLLQYARDEEPKASLAEKARGKGLEPGEVAVHVDFLFPCAPDLSLTGSAYSVMLHFFHPGTRKYERILVPIPAEPESAHGCQLVLTPTALYGRLVGPKVTDKEPYICLPPCHPSHRLKVKARKDESRGGARPA